jgi:hypothetical protein
MKSPTMRLHHRSPPSTSSTNSLNGVGNSSENSAAVAAASLAAWSSQAAAYHHMYPTSYSPNQALFYSNDPHSSSVAPNTSTMYGSTYRNADMDFLPPAGVYGRTGDEFMGTWPTSHHHHHHHQNFKIFN